MEYEGKLKPKIKIYLSVNKENFFKNFCGSFNLNYKILKEKFKNNQFDTVAIDFLPNKEYAFKFYPLAGLNRGLLYRVDKNSEICSVKIWLRLVKKIDIDKIIDNNFIKLPPRIKDIIIKNNFKINHLCEENGARSVYLR